MRKRHSMFGKLAYGVYVVQVYPNVQFSIHCISETSKLIVQRWDKEDQAPFERIFMCFQPFH